MGRLGYYRRILSAYLTSRNSQLSFWWETPQVNESFRKDEIGPYYMTFLEKANYQGPFDEKGIPLLDYHGSIGLQYNPIAIAQFGLGNYNLYAQTRSTEHVEKFLRIADWLVDQLEENTGGVPVWKHHFDWEYRETLKSPWYSGLAQGQGISVLVRAFKETKEEVYRDAASRAFQAFLKEVDHGGVIYQDADSNIWLEEYIVSPPSHILNGFVWASWGVHDYHLLTGEAAAGSLFAEGINTLTRNLARYDLGFWSLYELSDTRVKMVASPFYHRLHIVQLEILYRLTGREVFRRFADRWRDYQKSDLNRWRAMAQKLVFKIFYY